MRPKDDIEEKDTRGCYWNSDVHGFLQTPENGGPLVYVRALRLFPSPREDDARSLLCHMQKTLAFRKQKPETRDRGRKETKTTPRGRESNLGAS